MRSLIVLGAAASLLTVAACNRTDDAPTEAEAAAADAAVAATATGSTDATRASGAATPSDTATPYPTHDPMPPTTDGPSAPSPTSDATRDGAKEKAESTNLHPRTP